MPLWIDDSSLISPMELRAKARRLARTEENGLSLIVVDYLQLMQLPLSAENRVNQISEISRSLKSLAKEMGEASSLEAQKELQAYILALLNFNAEFGSYSSSLVDGIFYESKDIYFNKKIPENQRGLRNGLANEILHNKLVDLQWQK